MRNIKSNQTAILPLLISVPRNSRGHRRNAMQRRGAAAVLGVVLTLSLVTLTAFVIDFGHIHVAETEMRRSADAAAMAGCWEMFDQQAAENSPTDAEFAAFQAATEAAMWNEVNGELSQFGYNDVELGNYGVDESWDTSNPAAFNAVRVTLRRQSGMNGELPLFFGDLTGRDNQSLVTEATAAMFSQISGFYEPETGDETIGILPIALDLPTWLDTIAKSTEDDFACSNGQVSSGSDGIHECNLYPKGTGAPGNRGTVRHWWGEQQYCRSLSPSAAWDLQRGLR